MKSNLERINILCATDNNYAPYCGIMLTSLFESNRDCLFDVFVFIDGCLSDINKKKFKKLEQKYACIVNIMTIDDRLLENCPINNQKNVDNHSWVSKPTYYRLLAADLLPEEVKKVLYLDCDIAVVGDIKPLWNVDLTGKAIAGVTDCDEGKNRDRLGIPSCFTYFNAGVALYNLDYWRKNLLSDRFFEYIRKNEAELLLMDQDVVNGVLHDKMQLVPERYNFQVAFFAKGYWRIYSEAFRSTLLSENKVVTIVHYVGEIKPWDYRYYGSPYYAVWNKFRKRSLWKRNHITQPLVTYINFLVKKNLSSKALKLKRQAIWIVVPENEFCFI